MRLVREEFSKLKSTWQEVRADQSIAHHDIPAKLRCVILHDKSEGCRDVKLLTSYEQLVLFGVPQHRHVLMEERAPFLVMLLQIQEHVVVREAHGRSTRVSSLTCVSL